MNAEQVSGGSSQPIGKWLVLIGLILAVVCAVGAVFSGFGYQLGLWQFRTGFMVIRWAFFGALAAAAFSLIGLVMTKARPQKLLVTGLLGLVIGGITAYVPWTWKQTLDAHPYIHDITTDVRNPPQFVAAAKLRKEGDHPVTYDGPEVAEQQKKAYPDLISLTVPAPKDKVFAAAKTAVQAMKMELVDANEAEGRIEATATSMLYGFKDDMVVRLTSEGAGTRVDVRSKSRVGRSDLGQNAERIRTFLAKLSTSPV